MPSNPAPFISLRPWHKWGIRDPGGINARILAHPTGPGKRTLVRRDLVRRHLVPAGPSAEYVHESEEAGSTAARPRITGSIAGFDEDE